MKFKDFLDEEIDSFREMRIGLIDKKAQDAEKLVRKVQENFDLGTDLINLIDDLNKSLGNTYRGKYRFGWVLQDSQKINKLKINKNRKEKLKEQWFKTSSELAKKQTEFERKLVGD